MRYGVFILRILLISKSLSCHVQVDDQGGESGHLDRAGFLFTHGTAFHPSFKRLAILAPGERAI